MSRIAVIATVRTASKRLPNKVIFELGGKPAFIQAIERVTSVVNADYVVVACSIYARDDPIELFAKHYGIDCFRGPEEDVASRKKMCGDWLGLKDDDWYISAGGDAPLSLVGWIPWAMEQFQKHDCAHSVFVQPPNTLVWAVGIGGFSSWRQADCNQKVFGPEKAVHSISVRTACNVDNFRLSGGKVLIANWPSEYLRPWPWGLLHLDHEVQAVVLKEIYRRLYKGTPIDPLDVQKLFHEDPSLAEIIPVSLPKATNVTPNPRGSAYIRSVKLNTDYVELTWKGGIDVRSKYARKDYTKLTGGKSVETIT